jgi:F-type H+/Na+-transporting ATPase subunit alpha
VQDFLADLLGRLRAEQRELMDRMDAGELSDDDEDALGAAIAEMVDDFGPDFDEEGNPLEEGESDRIRAEAEHERPARTAEEVEGEAAAERERKEAERTVERAAEETEEVRA